MRIHYWKAVCPAAAPSSSTGRFRTLWFLWDLFCRPFTFFTSISGSCWRIWGKKRKAIFDLNAWHRSQCRNRKHDLRTARLWHCYYRPRSFLRGVSFSCVFMSAHCLAAVGKWGTLYPLLLVPALCVSNSNLCSRLWSAGIHMTIMNPISPSLLSQDEK